jgi:hypothetical protein
MKRLLILCFTSFLVLFLSCTEKIGLNDAGIPPDSNGNDGNVFKVFPTNSDDTENLLKAFTDAKAAGPGATVQLMFGKYYIRPIEVRDFDGNFQGYGRGITILSNLPDIPSDDYWKNNNLPYLIQFVGGRIYISDITIHIKDGRPCRDQSPINRSKIGDLLGAILVLADFTADYISADQHIQCIVNKVDFIAGNIMDGINPYGISGNVNMAIYCGSPVVTSTENIKLSEENITVTGCNFEQNVTGLYIRGFNENSTINSTENIFSGNVYQNLFLSCLGSHIGILKNSFLDAFYSDIYIDDNDYGSYPDIEMVKSTEYSISGNYFKGSPKLASLYMIDNRRINHPDEGFPQHFDIMANIFKIHEGGSAIVGLNIVGSKIHDNFFDATGTLGAIMIDGDRNSNTFSRDISISGNTFENVLFTFASVILGHYTTKCSVVCSATDKVIDYGIYNSVSGSKSNSAESETPDINYKFNRLNEAIIKMDKYKIYF